MQVVLLEMSHWPCSLPDPFFQNPLCSSITCAFLERYLSASLDILHCGQPRIGVGAIAHSAQGWLVRVILHLL